MTPLEILISDYLSANNHLASDGYGNPDAAQIVAAARAMDAKRVGALRKIESLESRADDPHRKALRAARAIARDALAAAKPQDVPAAMTVDQLTIRIESIAAK